jgi:glycosyltransferase involved in cell wall biosynthesis
MNVLHVAPSLDGRSWTRDIDILQRRLPSVSARVFCLGDASPAGESLLASSVQVEVRSSRRLLDSSMLWRLRSVLREESPATIHAWGMSAVRAIAAARFSSLKRTVVSAPLPPRVRDLSILDRWLLRQTSAIIARTNAEAVALRSVGISAQAIRWIPPGIEPAPQRVTRENRDPEILCVGRLEPHKGFRNAIWTHDILLQVFPSSRLQIAGQGTGHDDLVHFAKALSNNNVDLLGELSKPETLTAAADFGFALSNGGFGCRPILELMSVGLPVVASDLPHHRELIEDGETGYLVSVGEKIAPARRIRALLHDRQAAERISHTARQRVMDRFSADAFAERMAAVYAAQV